MGAQVTNIVEQTVLARMRAKASFTALDISNALKSDLYPVRHADVAATVRDIYRSGAMGHYDFDRRLIDVVTDGGAKKTQAFLYLHAETREREYTARAQASLPLVASDQARVLSDCAAASPLPHPAGRQDGNSRRRHAPGEGDAMARSPFPVRWWSGWDGPRERHWRWW